MEHANVSNVCMVVSQLRLFGFWAAFFSFFCRFFEPRFFATCLTLSLKPFVPTEGYV